MPPNLGDAGADKRGIPKGGSIIRGGSPLPNYGDRSKSTEALGQDVMTESLRQ